MSACRSCDARIRWALTEKNKPIPIDVAPRLDGNLVLEESSDGKVTIARAPRAGDESRPRYVSHFATCPNSHAHRKAAGT